MVALKIVGIFVFIIVVLLVVFFHFISTQELKTKINKYEAEIKSKGLVIDKIVFNSDTDKIDSSNDILYIDTKNKKWSIFQKNKSSVNIYNFSDIINYEIIENGNNITQGRTGSVVVGGLLFGGLGALAGASRAKKNQSTCAHLKIKIFINDLHKSSIIIDLIDKEITTDTSDYENAIKKAEEFESVLNYIVNSNKNISKIEEPITQKEKQQVKENNNNDIFYLLREYKKLLDDGIITEEEFNEKKNNLLKK